MILVLVGFSASGKDSVANRIANLYGYNFIVSTTTRPMRVGESQRNPYNFINNEEFQKLIDNDELVEYRSYDTLVNNIPATWFYGVENKEVDSTKNYVVVLDIVGLRGFRERFGNDVISFFLDTDDETRKERCINRGDFDLIEWNRRLLDDRARFTKEIIRNEMDYVILSYDIQETTDKIMKIVKKIDKGCGNFGE